VQLSLTMPAFLALPPEIHARVFEVAAINERRQLLATCRYLTEFRGFVWASVELQAADLGVMCHRIEHLNNTLRANPEYGALVKTVRISYPDKVPKHGTMDPDGIRRYGEASRFLDASVHYLLQLAPGVETFVFDAPRSIGDQHYARPMVYAMTVGAVHQLRALRTLALSGLKPPINVPMRPRPVGSAALKRLVVVDVPDFYVNGLISDQSQLREVVCHLGPWVKAYRGSSLDHTWGVGWTGVEMLSMSVDLSSMHVDDWEHWLKFVKVSLVRVTAAETLGRTHG
jgi:hypothetical protein